MVATHMSHGEGVAVTPNLLTRRLNLIKDYLIEWLASVGAAFGCHSDLPSHWRMCFIGGH